MLHSILRLLRSAALALLLVALLVSLLPLRGVLPDSGVSPWPTPAQLTPLPPGDDALGYRPAVRAHAGGIEAYRADGSCSTPWPAPAPFGLESACQVHDLAYDRLRVAHQRDAGTRVERMAARLRADLVFTRRSHEQCAAQRPLARIACSGVAQVFGAVVLLNSARQGFGAAPPESPVRLGLWGLALLIALGGAPALRRWNSAVGKHEREFLGLALPRAQLTRIYVGVRHGWSRRARLTHLVTELDRTGAFRGQTVCLVITTGSGWVNPYALSTLAQTASGPLTVVALQYSRLPSWAVLLLRPRLATRTASAALHAVADYRDGLTQRRAPTGAAPLVVHGESLGAGAIATALARTPTLARRLDGGVLVSPPGSVELAPPAGMVLVRHADDAVVWCTPALLWRAVRWRVAAGTDDVQVPPPWRRWWPVTTFLTVLRALPAAGDHPFGHGHRYGEELSDAWARALPPSAPAPPDHFSPELRTGAAQ
ncbi:alpha/beta-hydrolase family protein [Ruania zhangjianzhongii]|uniref:alpha/beta-hydrolase family protein n=1 Tax=Ruania zhangjianzhongii TaxID=2603206 RepID=UPI0011C91E96|nr:alpha/beta-hydrolase family protein [Ruania zhangjianzhongii]